MTLPEMIAGCHGDEEPEVYAGKTAFVSMQAFLQTLTVENLVKNSSKGMHGFKHAEVYLDSTYMNSNVCSLPKWNKHSDLNEKLLKLIF